MPDSARLFDGRELRTVVDNTIRRMADDIGYPAELTPPTTRLERNADGSTSVCLEYSPCPSITAPPRRVRGLEKPEGESCGACRYYDDQRTEEEARRDRSISTTPLTQQEISTMNGMIDFSSHSFCKRHPTPIFKDHSDWCGDFKLALREGA